MLMAELEPGRGDGLSGWVFFNPKPKKTHRTMKNPNTYHYNELPDDVKEAINRFDLEGDIYHECMRMESELKSRGWRFDWGLTAEPVNFRPIKEFKPKKP